MFVAVQLAGFMQWPRCLAFQTDEESAVRLRHALTGLMLPDGSTPQCPTHKLHMSLYRGRGFKPAKQVPAEVRLTQFSSLDLEQSQVR